MQISFELLIQVMYVANWHRRRCGTYREAPNHQKIAKWPRTFCHIPETQDKKRSRTYHSFDNKLMICFD